MPPDHPPAIRDDSTSPCATALRAIAAGTLSQFHGLPATCSRAAVAATLGASLHPDDGHGPAGPYREYPPTAAAPVGVVVFFDDAADQARAVRIETPVLAGDLDALGPPEHRAPSGVSRVADQLTWASRGLTLHVTRTGGDVRRLYAYPPMTVDEFLATAMATAEVRREPSRR